MQSHAQLSGSVGLYVHEDASVEHEIPQFPPEHFILILVILHEAFINIYENYFPDCRLFPSLVT
jgi:hypothetical protein